MESDTESLVDDFVKINEKEYECDRLVWDLCPDELNIIDSYCKNHKFLREDQNLLDVCTEDKKYLEDRKITCKQISDKIETIVQTFYLYLDDKKGSETITILGNCSINYNKNWCLHSCHEVEMEDYIVAIFEWGGSEKCPFKHPNDKKYDGYSHGCRDIIIRNKKNNSEIIFGDLLPHMIIKHNFFNGPGTSYRIEPSKIIETLDIQPEIDYSPKYVNDYKWNFTSGCSIGYSDISEELKILQSFATCYEIDENITIYYYKNEKPFNSKEYPTLWTNSEGEHITVFRKVENDDKVTFMGHKMHLLCDISCHTLTKYKRFVLQKNI
jgi:hypothetical protein